VGFEVNQLFAPEDGRWSLSAEAVIRRPDVERLQMVAGAWSAK
jgi:hypothetical protein